ncbi:hypothetical protein TEGL_35900 [Terrisporobacter glycolicus ATCC 14880 = DSM 1288]|uniref:CAAX prenyl protease 2/Lysostaphin resistance protein A-like domain-containing protein n=1 Tax=Terrisporobacter glycolicus ATCC 14880 = DSM 1288 TaxID=1121315 RepID=A0ABZ2F007_9FIRM
MNTIQNKLWVICLNIKEDRYISKNKEYVLDAIILLVIVQIARVIIKYIFLSQLNFTLENVNIANIISIMLVGISISLILRGNDLFNPPGQRLIKLNNRYDNKNIRLILGGAALCAVFVSPFFYGGYVSSNLIILILALIAQPIFEEMIFRDYVWNYIRSFQKDEKKVLVIVSFLSALFKIGYWDIVSQNLSVVGSSFFTIDIIISKVFFGLIIAFILGLVKMKYKDTYLCIFVHSLINVFFAR